MESLAVVVAFLFLTAVFAGPLAILISAPRIKSFLDSKEGFGWMLLKIVRKILHGLAVLLGFVIGSQLAGIADSVGKLIGLYAVITSYIALRREYFKDFYVVRNLLARLGIKRKEEPRIYSADGTEIIRAKKVTGFGRSSGKDGHGPEGQH